MTTQEIFDKVWAHAKTMTKPASDTRQCRYLTDDGRKCFIGALIPDGHPGQFFRGAVISLVTAYPDLSFASWVHEDRSRAEKLQACHDRNAAATYRGSSNFQDRCLLDLRAWARKYGAVVPE